MTDLGLLKVNIGEEATRMYELIKTIKNDYSEARKEKSKKQYKNSLSLYKNVIDDLDLLLIDVSVELEAERQHPDGPQLSSEDRSYIRSKIRALTVELDELTTSYTNDVMQDYNILRNHKDLYEAVRMQYRGQMADPWSLVYSAEDFASYIWGTRSRLMNITNLLGRYLEAL